MVWFGVVTLFPEMFQSISHYGITSRSLKKGLLALNYWNPRDFAEDKRGTVDDRPYGGGPGMVMMVSPLRKAIQQAKYYADKQSAKNETSNTTVIYLSPQGSKFNQQAAESIAKKSKIILVCGRYEGVDERLINTDIDEELSVGDYVLSGGELAAMLVIDAVTRLIPGALGHALSAVEDSFSLGLLDAPHYTRPEIIDNIAVPDLLLSGNHAAISRWRLKQSLGRTWLRRPDLLENLLLTKEQKALLEEFKSERQALSFPE